MAFLPTVSRPTDEAPRPDISALLKAITAGNNIAGGQGVVPPQPTPVAPVAGAPTPKTRGTTGQEDTTQAPGRKEILSFDSTANKILDLVEQYGQDTTELEAAVAKAREGFLPSAPQEESVGQLAGLLPGLITGLINQGDPNAYQFATRDIGGAFQKGVADRNEERKQFALLDYREALANLKAGRELNAKLVTEGIKPDKLPNLTMKEETLGGKKWNVLRHPKTGSYIGVPTSAEADMSTKDEVAMMNTVFDNNTSRINQIMKSFGYNDQIVAVLGDPDNIRLGQAIGAIETISKTDPEAGEELKRLGAMNKQLNDRMASKAFEGFVPAKTANKVEIDTKQQTAVLNSVKKVLKTIPNLTPEDIEVLKGDVSDYELLDKLTDEERKKLGL